MTVFHSFLQIWVQKCTYPSLSSIQTYLIWKPTNFWQFDITNTSWANVSIMLKRVAKVEIFSKSSTFETKLKILWCKMWPYSKLDLRFEFHGQFWCSKVVLRSCFSSRTPSVTYLRFTQKMEIFLQPCPNFAIKAKYMMSNDFKVTSNG